jgi:hypothetical protein
VKPVRIALALAALATFPVASITPARADCKSSCSIFGLRDQSARLAPRQNARDAEVAINTENGEVTLLLTRDVVALQLSDRTLRKIRRDLRENDGEETDDGMLGQVIRTAVFSIVSGALTHSVEYPLSELRDVKYEDGELVLRTQDGDRLFHKVEINDTPVFRSFSAEDARDFVREFQRLKPARSSRVSL